MLTVALNAMANALEVHASEFIGDGVFLAAKVTPELRKKLEGMPTTSTPCKALFAAVKRRAVVEGVARHDSRMGVVMAKRDRTTEWAQGPAGGAARAVLGALAQAHAQGVDHDEAAARDAG